MAQKLRRLGCRLAAEGSYHAKGSYGPVVEGLHIRLLSPRALCALRAVPYTCVSCRLASARALRLQEGSLWAGRACRAEDSATELRG